MKKLLYFSLLILFSFFSIQGQKNHLQNQDSLNMDSSNQDTPNQYTKLLSESGGKTVYKNAPYIIIFEETNTKMMDSGLNHVNKEILFKILTKKGARDLHSFILGYDPGSAYIEFKKVQILKKNGKVVNVPLTGVRDYTASARAIYWGAKEKIIPIGRLEPGDGLLIKTYMKGFTYALLMDTSKGDDSKYIPPMKGHFYDIIPFYSNYHILRKTYKLSVPINKKLQFEFYNGEARHYSRNKGDRINYLWEKKDIKPIKREKNMVNLSDVAPKLLLSTSPDWKAKSLWFYKVNEDFGSFDTNDAINKKVKDIIKDSKNDWDKISALTHWVADEIRYSGISMGEGEGFTLHKGAMTFNDRCGVCKDKAGMLITMLRVAGFESYPAMTMAGSRIDKIPADQFNHCVTLVKVKNKYHLLDPTWVPGVRELWSSAEQQQEYLMGVPEGADLNSTPLSPPEKHYLKYNIKSTLDKNGTLSGKIIISAEGQTDSGFRRGFTRYNKTEWKRIIQRNFYNYNPLMIVKNLSYTNPYDISDPFEMSFNFKIPDFADSGLKNTYIKPLSSKLPFSYLLSFNRINTKIKKRKFPFRTRCSQLISVNEKLSLPKGLKLLDKIKLKNIKGPGADFTGYIKQKGKIITIKKQLKLKKRIYQPEDWNSVKQSVLEFKTPKSGVLILKKRSK